MTVYKVIILRERDGDLETTLNTWAQEGWKLNCIETEHTTQIVVFEREQIIEVDDLTRDFVNRSNPQES